MAKEITVRRVHVPLLREDDDALRDFAHLGLEEGQLIRAFWRIGLKHREEFLAGRPLPAAEPPTSLAARRARKR